MQRLVAEDVPCLACTGVSRRPAPLKDERTSEKATARPCSSLVAGAVTDATTMRRMHGERRLRLRAVKDNLITRSRQTGGYSTALNLLHIVTLHAYLAPPISTDLPPHPTADPPSTPPPHLSATGSSVGVDAAKEPPTV